MPDNDSQLSQHTVDLRNEERLSASGRTTTTSRVNPVYAEIIAAIQRVLIVEESASDDESCDYDNGYSDGLNRAADIVQIIARGGKPAS